MLTPKGLNAAMDSSTGSGKNEGSIYSCVGHSNPLDSLNGRTALTSSIGYLCRICGWSRQRGIGWGSSNVPGSGVCSSCNRSLPSIGCRAILSGGQCTIIGFRMFSSVDTCSRRMELQLYICQGIEESYLPKHCQQSGMP